MKTFLKTICIGLVLSIASPAFANATLYEDLGGDGAMTEIVDRMMDYSLADKRIAEKFENSNIDRLKPLLVQHFCFLADGPCTFEGQDMRRVHTGLDIKTKHFNALVENLQKAMRDMDIPFATQNDFIAILAPIHKDVVNIPYEQR